LGKFRGLIARLLPLWLRPCRSLHVGDFNCQHVNWGYNKTLPDGESLDSWETFNNLGLLYNQKTTASFFSHRWNAGTNPDLAFANFGQDSRLPDRRVLGKFPKPQRRPSLITPPTLKVPVHSDPVKRWNLRKADWKRFCLLTDESVERLPPPDTSNIERAYQNFCESLLAAAKQCIPRGRWKNYVPCCDKQCETSYRSFTRDPVALTLIEPLRPYSLGSGRSRGDGRKLSIPSTSRTLAPWRGEPSTTLLPGLDDPFGSARLGKLHRLPTFEERGTQDQRPRVHQARQQGAVRPMEDSNT